MRGGPFHKGFILLKNLERAMGFEPTTPTLAKSSAGFRQSILLPAIAR
jgi:hypothetical protein